MILKHLPVQMFLARLSHNLLELSSQLNQAINLYLSNGLVLEVVVRFFVPRLIESSAEGILHSVAPTLVLHASAYLIESNDILFLQVKCIILLFLGLCLLSIGLCDGSLV